LCNPINRNENTVIDELDQNTQKILKVLLGKVTHEAIQDIKNRNAANNIVKNFNKTCAPTSFDVFLEVLLKMSKKNNVPADLLLGLMTQESSGRCGSSNKEGDGSKSVGLFQLNTGTTTQNGTTTSKSCGDDKNSLLNPECLENPFQNLSEAIRVLKKKYKTVNNSYPDGGEIKFKDHTFDQRNSWRKAIAAYNGGEGYIFQAYRDIQKFNKEHGLNIDADNWEVRKIFMLRKALEDKSGRLLSKDKSFKYRRSEENTIGNLRYVEAIISSEKGDQTYNQASKWESYLNPAPITREVPSDK